MPVCIVGMHRSGTSMVANLLRLSGLYLGEEADLAIAGPDNPDGFWEHPRLVVINDHILNELGGAWDVPPPTPVRWAGIRLDHLRATAAVVVQEFEGREPWGWKDPRTSLTLPFWLNLLSDTKVVVVLRHPLEVAASLRQRGGHGHTSHAFGVTLWSTYNERIFASVPAEARIVTHFDAYFHDPVTEVQRLLAFVGLPITDDGLERCLGAVSAGLRHSRFTSEYLLKAEAAPQLFDQYRAMCDEAAWMDDRTSRPSATMGHRGNTVVAAGVTGRDARAAPEDGVERELVPAPGIGRISSAAVELGLLWGEHARYEMTVRTLEAALRAEVGKAASLSAELAQRDTTIRDLQARLTHESPLDGAPRLDRQDLADP